MPGKAFVIPTVFKAQDQMSGQLKTMQRSVQRFTGMSSQHVAKLDRKFKRLGATMQSIGSKMLIGGAIMATPFIFATREAVRFEDQLTDIAKTTGISGSKLSKFGQELLEISKATRTSADELVKIAVIGGQMSVAEKDLLSFTKAADTFSVALADDFAGGTAEAIMQVSKLVSIFKETRELEIGEGISRAGSVINELGAKTKATSANLAQFTLEVGQIPEALRPTIQNTMALGAVLESAGIDAKIGGSGLNKFFRSATTVLPLYARQMKITTAEAKALLENSPTEFLLKFSQSLQNVDPARLGEKLKDFKLNTKEVIAIVSTFKDKTDELRRAQEIAGQSFIENSSLQTEAATKNASAAAQIEMLKNQVRALAVQVGNALLPVFKSLLKAVGPMLQKFATWVSRNEQLFIRLVKVGTVIATLTIGVGGLLKVVGTAVSAWKLLTVAVGAFLSPVGAAITALTLLTTTFALLFTQQKQQVKVNKLQNELAASTASIYAQQSLEVHKLFKSLRALNPAQKEFKTILQQIDQLSPGIVDQYKLQKGAIEDINSAEKELLKTVFQRARAQAASQLFEQRFTAAVEAQTLGKEVTPAMVKDLVLLQRQMQSAGNVATDVAVGQERELLRQFNFERQMGTAQTGGESFLPAGSLDNESIFNKPQPAFVEFAIGLQDGLEVRDGNGNPQQKIEVPGVGVIKIGKTGE